MTKLSTIESQIQQIENNIKNEIYDSNFIIYKEELINIQEKGISDKLSKRISDSITLINDKLNIISEIKNNDNSDYIINIIYSILNQDTSKNLLKNRITTEIESLGKDNIGHSLYNLVQNTTNKILIEYSKNFEKPTTSREMGDLYFNYNKFHIPINVKFMTKLTEEGAPNMVSLKRVIKNININGIYIMIFICLEDDNSIKIIVEDYYKICNSNYISYDAGPGQTMLKKQNYIQDYFNNNVQYVNKRQDTIDFLSKLKCEGIDNKLKNMVHNLTLNEQIQFEKNILLRLSKKYSPRFIFIRYIYNLIIKHTI